jgi:sarcosine oxidase subunit gamma
MRISPLFDALSERATGWRDVNGMRTATSFAAEADAATLGLADVSCLARTGLKGPQAASWLARNGLPVPGEANTWAPLDGGGVIGRLAWSEFFVEDGPGGANAARIAAALVPGTTGVYPVLRQDCALVLSGRRSLEVLAQTCSVNFGALEPGKRPLLMTSIAGVSVLVIPEVREGAQAYRIWCDPSFAPYLFNTLLEISEESGGGPLGFARVYPASIAT